MQRREFLYRAAVVTGSAAVCRTSAGAWRSAETVSARLTLDPARTIVEIPPDFVGLGYEISSVARPGLLSRKDAVYVQLVRTLGALGIIRIGGDTSDYSSYAPAAEPLSSPETGPGSVVNDAVLRELGAFLEATGWKLIWGLNLGRGTKKNAIEEARAVLAATRPSLLAFEIGNEPDLFAHREIHRKKGYGYEDFLREYREFRDALRKELPGIPLAGPDVAIETSWVTEFARDEGKDIKFLTHHYYREGQNPTSSIDKLLNADPKLAPMLAQLSSASKSSGLPYRICETNSFSGGGKPGVSDAFASALWVLSFMYNLAAGGCGGVNLETGVNQLGFVSSYSPIGEDEPGHCTAAPEYYGMLAFAQAGMGRLFGCHLEAGGSNLEAFATQPGDDRRVVTLIHKGGGSDALVHVEGAGASEKASVLRLTGPSLDSKTGVRFGGVEVTATGEWRPAQVEEFRIEGGKVLVRVPAASAAVVTLHT
ncbi:MAG TPA: glycosyl hydrolase family 79 C-terminal domain-containing protein [Terriglobales bacterium]|nr:glycosyl hydrolase family 79 C-terminal domain-containing protein [Terriglobales bacterium]